MEMTKLVEMSQKYGKNPDFVLAGGGNTSYKTDDLLFVKGSGSSLATICPEQFVKLCRKSLNDVMTKTYSDDEATREAQVLSDMMDARCKGEEAKRPSVECLLHNLFHIFLSSYCRIDLLEIGTSRIGNHFCKGCFPGSWRTIKNE